jgi:two-component system response regulator ResD
MAATTVLLVEDEPHLRELLRVYLEAEGFRVIEAEDGTRGLELACGSAPDLVILDLMLPGLDGRDVCRRLRERSRVPIIMLTARSDEVDRVVGLELGADDYVTKPFSPRELMARVRAVLRRVEGRAAASDGDDARLAFADFVLDRRSRELLVRGSAVPCPPKEFDLLWMLAAHPRRVFTREELLNLVWGYDHFGDLRTVDVHVRRLREKIERDPSVPRLLKTVWGVGYKFEEELGS